MRNIKVYVPCNSLPLNELKGRLSSFSSSEDDLLERSFLIKKKVNIPLTTRIDITIPAIPPPLMPDFLPPLFGLLSSPFFGLGGLLGVPGGGGGAGPVLNELPSFLPN